MRSVARPIPRGEPIDVERGSAAGDDQSTGQNRRETETSGSGNNTSGSLSPYQCFGHDAADSRGTILGGDRGAHSDLALSRLVERNRWRPVLLTGCGCDRGIAPPFYLRS